MRRYAALLCATLAVAGCGERKPPVAVPEYRVLDQPAVVQELRRHIDQFPRTLDPALSEDQSAQRVLDDLFEGLLRLDPQGGVVPAVARRWETSEDGKRWVFHLREDARWSDGAPVTAEDFVYAWRRTADPRTGSPNAQGFLPLVNATQVTAGKLASDQLGVRAVDALTLEVSLEESTAYFASLVTTPYFYPVQRNAVETGGEQWTRPGKLVSNGAFTLRDYRVGGSITLVKNEAYWDAQAVGITKVTYFPIGDRAAASSRFIAGGVDVTDSVAAEDVAWLRKRLGTQLVVAPFLGTMMFAMDVVKPPFDRKPLRLAMTMAIDRDILARYVLKDVYLPAYNLVPPLPGYTPVLPDWARLPRAERHAAAQKLYQEAGYSKQRPLRVELVYPTSSPDVRRMMEALAAMWRMNLGAEVQIYNEEWRVLQQNRRLGLHRFYWYSWLGDYPDPLTFVGLFRAGNGQNFGGYLNADYDRLVNEAEGMLDPQARARTFGRAEALLNEDAPFVPIYYYTSRHLLKPYVRGWQANALDRHLTRDLTLLAHATDGER
ncbi:MAG: peptide ABC transporter substrate-binding protein [Steroidobacteraceae bacterium]